MSGTMAQIRSLLRGDSRYAPLPTHDAPAAQQQAIRHGHTRRALKLTAAALMLTLLGSLLIASLYVSRLFLPEPG